MAAKEGTWEFQCPQYVDFSAGLNSSGRTDVYFECKDHLSPTFDEVFTSLQSPGAKIQNKCLTREAENKLINKMNAALTIIENTPKLALMKKKTLSEAVNRKNLCERMAETAKRKTTLAPAARIQRSKSVAVIDKIGVDKQNKVMGMRKRSSSLGDLRTAKKPSQKERGLIKKSPSINDLKATRKQTYAMTPMCLKRTITKQKTKIKTTEEMELEEIAKLQKQLIAHLRFNEISLKRLKLKPRTYLNPKGTQIKEENLKEIKGGARPFLEKLNLEQQREPRRNLQKLTHEALKHEAMKTDSAVNPPRRHKTVEKICKENGELKTKNSSVSSASHQVSKKHALKIGFHSGLAFHDNGKKHTIFKPFSFDSRVKEVKDQNSKTEASLSNSVFSFKIDDFKENILQNRTGPAFNPKNVNGLQNLKSDNIQHLGSNKRIVQKRVANQIRGSPLSENITRH